MSHNVTCCMCHNDRRDSESLQHNKEITINLHRMEVRQEMTEEDKNTFLFICYGIQDMIPS